jgi:RNA polymerase sigma factor (sigma-70 family)
MATNIDELIPTRRSLLSRLRNCDDQESWKHFFDTYWKLIYGVARKAGLGDAEAQDVVQETIIAVARNLPDFRYDPAAGSFKRWLLQMTRWRIIDQIRKKHYESGGKRIPREQSMSTTLLETQPDLAAFKLDELWEQEWKKNLMDAALDKVKQQVSPSQYQLFYLHVIKKLPAKKVAERVGVKLAEVYFAKYKVSALVKKQIKALEKSGF